MAIYEFKYNIGDNVWTILGNKVQTVEVVGHKVEASKYSYRDGNKVYLINKTNVEKPLDTVTHEKYLFGSKKELLESL